MEIGTVEGPFPFTMIKGYVLSGSANGINNQGIFIINTSYYGRLLALYGGLDDEQLAEGECMAISFRYAMLNICFKPYGWPHAITSTVRH
jgi:hypothetical protein